MNSANEFKALTTTVQENVMDDYFCIGFWDLIKRTKHISKVMKRDIVKIFLTTKEIDY